jgi:hypothetical protein
MPMQGHRPWARDRDARFAAYLFVKNAEESGPGKTSSKSEINYFPVSPFETFIPRIETLHFTNPILPYNLRPSSSSGFESSKESLNGRENHG